MASGIGIAAHLLAIRHLLQAHEDKTARVRRISLLWFLEQPGKLLGSLQAYFLIDGQWQEQWALDFLHMLMDMDNRRIFTIHLYNPHQTADVGVIPTVAQADSARQHLFRIDGPLDVGWSWHKRVVSKLVTWCCQVTIAFLIFHNSDLNRH